MRLGDGRLSLGINQYATGYNKDGDKITLLPHTEGAYVMGHPTAAIILELNRMWDVVRRLPHTADGVPVLTGDVVYGPVIVGKANGRGQTGYGIQEHIVISVPEHPSEPPTEWLTSWGISSGNSGPMVDISGTTPISMCWSSYDVALMYAQ